MLCVDQEFYCHEKQGEVMKFKGLREYDDSIERQLTMATLNAADDFQTDAMNMPSRGVVLNRPWVS